jgi:16S rRNA processing protein RimM
MTVRRVCLGAFAGAHGVRGQLKARTFTESEEGICRYGPVESEDGARRFSLRFIRTLKPGLALVAAPEIRSREEAAALSGARIYVSRDRLPPLAEGEYYAADLIGLAVRDEAGAALGIVSSVQNFGAGDILEIAEPGRPPLLVPFIGAAVRDVDLASGVVTISSEALREI